MAPFDRSYMVSYSPSIVPMVLSCIICEIKRDIGRKSSFFHTPLYSTPPLGVSPSEYCHSVRCGKTRMARQPDGEKNFEDMCNRLDTIPACDRRTDRHLSTLCIHVAR